MPNTTVNLATPAPIQATFALQRNGKEPFSLNVDLTLPATGVTALFGPSGSGKTTLLRCIAGLEQAQRAELIVNQVTWENRNQRIPTHKRPIGMVFQDANLFPHLSARQNLHYAIKRADQPITREFQEQIIDIMGIREVLTNKPHQLSGGEQQRVAIARALLIYPSLLLMDEPLASLDYARKQEILPYLEKLKRYVDIPVLYVSHSMEEIARLADYAVLLNQGEVVAQGSVNEVFTRSDLPTQFRNDASAVLDGEVLSIDNQWHLATIQLPGCKLLIPDQGLRVGKQIRLRIMASDITLSLEKVDAVSTLNQVEVSISSISANTDAATAMISLKLGKSQLIAKVTRYSIARLALHPNQQLWAQIKSAAILK